MVFFAFYKTENMHLAAEHITVMAEHAVAALMQGDNGVFVDATFGRGGHTRRILAGLGPTGRVLALDRDPEAIAAGRALNDARLCLFHRPFSDLGSVLHTFASPLVDGILLDLGVSSPQLDEAHRGMSFRFDAPLDMRMDTTQGQTAADWLASATPQQITEVLRNYGEERFAHAIAKAIVAAREGQPITTTRQLATLVEKTLRTREPGQHPATRTFQALRIFINRELEELTLILPQALKALKPGGRLVVISFHSLEDRIVKRFIRTHASPPRLPARLPVRADALPAPSLRALGRFYPSPDEIAANPRARSAVMRVAERTDSRPHAAA
jgi:16S rRNA (cytosine1402-N4)-methyltransferase